MLRRRPHQDELLRRLTAEADHAHQLGMATLPGELEVAHFGTDDDALVASRRQFLRRAGSTAIVAGAVAVPLGAGLLAGLATGTWGSWDDLAATWSPASRVEPVGPANRERWADALERAAGWIGDLSSLDF